MNHTDQTKNIRNRIKQAGIKASVSKYESCGKKWVRICTPSYDVKGFTSPELDAICTIAQVNDLTWTMGAQIERDNLSENHQEFHFVWNPGMGYYSQRL